MTEMLSLLAVGIVTAVGIGLSYFGYEVAQKVLALAGAVAGFAAGIFVGGFVYPAATGEPQIVALTLFAGLVGAGLGSAIVPGLSEVAFGLAGFTVTSVSVLGFLSRGKLVDVILTAIPSNAAEANPIAILERIAASPLFADPNFEQAMLIAVVLGLVGGAIAVQFYDEFVAVATTAVGASILGLAVPLLLVALEGGAVANSSAAEFSLLWFGVTFLTGSAFELYRNREEMTVV